MGTSTIIGEVTGQPLEARAVNSLLYQSQRLVDTSIETTGHDGSRCFMVISPFPGPTAKEHLAGAGISWSDAIGAFGKTEKVAQSHRTPPARHQHPIIEVVQVKSVFAHVQNRQMHRLERTLRIPSAIGHLCEQPADASGSCIRMHRHTDGVFTTADDFLKSRTVSVGKDNDHMNLECSKAMVTSFAAIENYGIYPTALGVDHQRSGHTDWLTRAILPAEGRLMPWSAPATPP